MKTFLLAVSLLMLGVSSNDVQASTYAECWNSCGTAYRESCGWMRKRLKRKRCTKRLLARCQYWGVETICPAPPPPTTTTQPPAIVTTTTTPYVPPTTTTTVPARPDFRGSYILNGTFITDTCGIVGGVGATNYMLFSVTGQTTTGVSGTIGGSTIVTTARGPIYDDGSFALFGTPYWYEGCQFEGDVGVDPRSGYGIGRVYTVTPCGGIECLAELEGTVARR